MKRWPRPRRTWALAALTVAGMALAAAPAQATFHLEKVNEVMLASSTGNASVQFVELVDRGGTEEEFTPVFAPYKLVIYDGAGNKLGEHTLNPDGLRPAAATGREYLISTAAADAAFGVSGDERLDVSLPRNAGQACFEANPNPPAFSCLTWGSITKPVPTNATGSGSVSGPVPPNGASDQRQPNDSVVAAIPTPKAPNRSTAPGNPALATPFAGIGVASRTAKVKRGRAAIRLRCPVGTNGSCRGKLTLRPRRGRAVFGSARFTIAASKSKVVRVKLSRTARRRLARHRRLGASVRVDARDAAGTPRTSRGRVTIVGPRHKTV
jgi:hypothetical protein